MQNIEMDLRERYFSDALHFFQNYYGKENVLYCQYHLGEDNPHIHIGIMPDVAQITLKNILNCSISEWND